MMIYAHDGDGVDDDDDGPIKGFLQYAELKDDDDDIADDTC